jgi:hypothetical protein
MGWTFAQITAKRAAIRQRGLGIPITPGVRTFSQVMSNTSATASSTTSQSPENNLGTIEGNNLVRMDGNNLVRIS